MTIYKVLNENGTSTYQGVEWPLPDEKPGAWMRAEGPLELCVNGLHFCDGERQLLSHLGPMIYEAEVRGERIDGDDKIAVREARLVRRIPQWNERTARLFACLCAERVLGIFGAKRPNDDRPRKAIEVARRFANGEATRDELDAARAAAGDATRDATRDAARDAAWDAARAAARDAARPAAWAAARDGAWAAARDWQADRLRELLTAPGDWR